MHINVQVQNSWVHFKQLQNTQYNVIYVAKATGLSFFAMMKPSCPVYHDVGLLS